MRDSSKGGYLTMRAHLLNGRLFQQLLNKEPEAQYRSEQGKILTCLWKNEGRRTATDIAMESGLANNTLTNMIKKMKEQGLVEIEKHPTDKRKKIIALT